jgi:hypothetical protein
MVGVAMCQDRPSAAGGNNECGQLAWFRKSAT